MHSLLPPHEATGFTSASAPFAFGVSYTGHPKAVIATSDEKPVTRSFGPGTIGINGPRPLNWIRVREPSEGLEIHPATPVLAEVSDLTGCDWQAHDRYLQLEADPVLWGICTRFRMSALGARETSGLEADSLIHDLAMHVAVRYLQCRWPRTPKGRLDQRRLTRVDTYLKEKPCRPVSLAELSSVAAMSPYHFLRLFKRSTGLSPSEYAMALRVEHARRRLLLGRSVRDAAAATGFRDLSYFRRCYRRYLGTLR